MKISYDKQVDVLLIEFQGGRYHVSEEVSRGVVIDRSKEGKLLRIEIMDASKQIPKENFVGIFKAPSIRKITRKQAERKILGFIKKHEGALTSEIADRLRLDILLVSEILQKLSKKGLVK